MAHEHLLLLRLGGVADDELEEEAVELRLGQRVGALVLDGVLGGDHEERVGQRAGVPSSVTCRSCMASSSADCVLGGVRLISSARSRLVNTGPGRKRKLPSARLVEHALPDDVAGHEVGRELHALEVHVERRGDRLHQQGLRRAGHTLEQDVAPHEQRGHQAGQRALLAHDHLADLLAQGEDRRPHVVVRRRARGAGRAVGLAEREHRRRDRR